MSFVRQLFCKNTSSSSLSSSSSSSSSLSSSSSSLSCIILKNVAKFSGKHLCLSPFKRKMQVNNLQLYEKTPSHLLSCEFHEIFRIVFLQNASRQLLLSKLSTGHIVTPKISHKDVKNLKPNPNPNESFTCMQARWIYL